MHFWVILLTDRQTNEHGQKHLPPPLLEVIIDSVWAVVMLRKWRKIIRTVLCCIVYQRCAEWYVHTYGHLLQMAAALALGLFLVLLHLLHDYVHFVCVRVCFCIFCIFSLVYVTFVVSTSAVECVERLFPPKWCIMCRVERWTVITHSMMLVNDGKNCTVSMLISKVDDWATLKKKNAL